MNKYKLTVIEDDEPAREIDIEISADDASYLYTLLECAHADWLGIKMEAAPAEPETGIFDFPENKLTAPASVLTWDGQVELRKDAGGFTLVGYVGPGGEITITGADSNSAAGAVQDFAFNYFVRGLRWLGFTTMKAVWQDCQTRLDENGIEFNYEQIFNGAVAFVLNNSR